MPIEYELEHNSPEWFAARCGIPTSSSFKDFVQPTTGELSRSKDKKDLSVKSYTYMDKLLAERITGTWDESPWTMDMERGKLLEPTAAELYEFMTGTSTRKNVFITDDKGTMGASPDRLVGQDGLLEIKCPKANTHVKYMRLKKKALDADYKAQYQAQMMITGRKFVDVFAYHPEMQPVLIRVERDENYIKNLRDAATEFIIKMGEVVAQLEKSGMIEPIRGAA